jgi:hypothetical protein
MTRENTRRNKNIIFDCCFSPSPTGQKRGGGNSRQIVGRKKKEKENKVSLA